MLVAGLTPPASAALSRALLDATVRASLGFVERRSTEVAFASDTAVTLARRMLYAMTISQLKNMGAATLVCILALGAPTLTRALSGGLKVTQQPAAASPEGDDSDRLLRAVDQLEGHLDETANRHAAMRRDLLNIRTGLKTLSRGARTSAVTVGAIQVAQVLDEPALATARLVAQLKRHPVQPKPAFGRIALYITDARNGETILIADQPAPGLTNLGSAVWSHDGRRILFDATPGNEWSLTRLWSIEVGKDRPTLTDLGTGNCPSFSPADDRIFLLSNAPDMPRGVWLMNADGTERRHLGQYGKPIWSPDGRQLMIICFTAQRQVMIMDADPAKSGELQLPGRQIHAYPSWTAKGTIVAAIGSTEGDTIALIDVSDPSQAKVTEVLWRRATGPDVEPSSPVYSETTGHCIFVGRIAGRDDMALYSIQRNAAGPAKPLRPDMHEGWVADVSYSPDGRYIVYSSANPKRPK
jgi:hypothetical protein